MRLRQFLAAAALVAAARPCAGQVFAQVLPLREAVTVRGTAPVTRDVVVTNRGATPAVVRVRLADWTLDESGGVTILPPGTLPASLAGCLRFEPESFSLPPGESAVVRVTLTLPADGPPTRWGVLLSEVRPVPDAVRGLGPRAVAELGTTFYLSRVPPERAVPELVGLRAVPAGADSLAITVRVRNAGERQFHVRGTIDVADSAGTTLRSGALPAGVVLPGSEREFTWMCDSGPGARNAIATLDTGQPELLVGEARLARPRGMPALATRP
jgi:hypothetical protein